MNPSEPFSDHLLNMTRPELFKRSGVALEWLLVGGGVKRGITYRRTDEFGYNIVEKPEHVHDLNATMLHQLGLHHEWLTNRYQGRAFRLTDVRGKVVNEIVG
jgi:uncharacterized protein DUF1501